MTKQEAIEILSALWKKDILPVDGQDALVIAIKALEQTNVPDTNVGDLISRQAVIDTIETDCSWDIFNEWGSRTPTGECIINAIKSVPSVEPERKLGKWIPVYDDNGRCYDFRCSACNGADEYGSKFCPNCGAKMEV